VIASSAELATLSDSNRAAARRLAFQSGAVAAAVVAVPVIVVVGLLVSWIIGVIAGVVLGAVAAILWVEPRRKGAVDVLLTVVGARPASEADFPRYANLIESVGSSAGVEEPHLYVVDEDHANLMVLGSAEGGVLIATTGLLSSLGRVELEGVLAEGLYRIRVNEAELATQAAVFLAGPLVRNGPQVSGGSLPRTASLAERRVGRLHALLPERGHMIADLSASGITRFPPGLRDGLIRMESVGTSVACATWGTAHLWMCDPFPAPSTAGTPAGDSVAARLSQSFANHPPVQHRIDLLAEL
jgi:heat shock protein HtpX